MSLNIRKWHLWRSSLRLKLILSVLVMTLPLVGMLLYNNFYAIDVVRGQVADSYSNMLGLYKGQIDDSLSDIDNYMNSITGIGVNDVLSLGQFETDTDYYSAKVFLFNKLNRDILMYPSLGSFFVYVPSRDDYMDVTQRGVTINEKDRIQRHVVDSIRGGRVGTSSIMRWQYDRIGDGNYLFHFVQAGNVYLGGWVRTEQLLSPLRALQIGEEGAVLLANRHGVPITDAPLVSDYGIVLKEDMSRYYLSGADKKFLVVGAASRKSDFQLVAVIPDQHILANLPYLQSIVWLITAATLLFVPIGLYLMRQAILVPLHRVLLTMKRVRSGDWSSRVSLPKASDEFVQLGDAFNSMMTEIEELRVNVFEEQLHKQREELQRLQLQVNPHFFLNALNIVYNLAKVKNHELILEMTMSLMHYFRFMFRSNTSLVKLKDELEHTRNYLRIQSLRFPGRLLWTVDAPEYLSDTPIPPLVIQSFVENSIKHAMTMEEQVIVSVRIRFADEDSGSRLTILIEDTGPGFEEKVLEELKAGRSVENERGERTGIWNVHRRLRLMYRNDAFVTFNNCVETGGAVVEIVLPTDPEREEEK